jgi:hypothetical protein
LTDKSLSLVGRELKVMRMISCAWRGNVLLNGANHFPWGLNPPRLGLEDFEDVSGRHDRTIRPSADVGRVRKFPHGLTDRLLQPVLVAETTGRGRDKPFKFGRYLVRRKPRRGRDKLFNFGRYLVAKKPGRGRDKPFKSTTIPRPRNHGRGRVLKINH